MSADSETGLFVIVELGASWPGWLVEGASHGTRRVLSELEGEGPTAFAARVIAAAATLMPRGVRLDLSVLALNERGDEAQMRARRELVRALVYPRDRRRSRVLLAVPARASERLRDALGALASGLGAVKGARERVRVCIEERASDPVSSPGALVLGDARVAVA
jgi:hypothetical protein